MRVNLPSLHVAGKIMAMTHAALRIIRSEHGARSAMPRSPLPLLRRAARVILASMTLPVRMPR
jgi:hypothetical protein